MTLDGTYDNEENVHVLTRIPGRSENQAEYSSGEPQYKYSALSDHFDEWFHGDFVKGWADDLDIARSTKTPAEYFDSEKSSFRNYRMDAAVEVGFDTSGNSISGTPEVKMTDPDDQANTPGDLAMITLEGESDEPPNKFRNQFDHYDDHESGQFHSPDIPGRYTKTDTNFTVSTENGDVEGVRVSLILGASDPYLRKLKSDIVTLREFVDPAVSLSTLRFVHAVPTFYSFIDFSYMADGTKVVTIWDASRWPAHALYVGGDYKRENKFREGIEWDELGWTATQSAFMGFGIDADLNPGATPFDQGGHYLYQDPDYGYTTGHGDHPVMVFVHVPAGSELTGNEEEFNSPMFPDFPLI